MATKYTVCLPNKKEMTFGLPYGSVTLTHGQVVDESHVTKAFPEFFIIIPTEKEIKKAYRLANQNTETTEETIVKPTVDFKKDGTPKKKAGRPRKGTR